MRRSAQTVKPSLSQKCSIVAFVTRLPVQEWASSCTTTSTSERSPAMSVGVRNVSRGFSIPPYGKEGGRTSMSKRSQSYGPKSASARPIIPSISANSWAAAGSVTGSAHTRERGERSRLSSRPTANASR